MKEIDINEYDYYLPEDRIAQYPAKERDLSKILIYKNSRISKDVFRNIAEYIPPDSLLVFNNTRVIRARILFRKQTGAAIEILCLEPVNPSEYTASFGSVGPVEWKCMVGNQKKWKSGILTAPFFFNSKKHILSAVISVIEGDTCNIRFSWDNDKLCFGEVIESIGHIPLPPYINRTDEKEDTERYQTVYSRIDGSVAAPTAGLHFTPYVLDTIKSRGIESAELTLHVGAGTFRPVKERNIFMHEMHAEHFSVDIRTIETLIRFLGRIIPVGTTSVRTIESLYWLGVKLMTDNIVDASELYLDQWDAYSLKPDVSAEESLKTILKYCEKNHLLRFEALTKIMIVPSYKFRLTDGIITNFHQPKSTLLLLISAWCGEIWKDIYSYAINNDFRFLSYGDSSLLIK